MICTSTALCFLAGKFVGRPNGILKFGDMPQRNSYPGVDSPTRELEYFKSLDFSNDPTGFSIGDFAAYGGLGHILGFGALASLELQEILAKKEGAYTMPFFQVLQGVPFDEVESFEALGL